MKSKTSTTNRVKSFFEGYAKKSNSGPSWDSLSNQYEADMLVRTINLPKGARLLELGCGTGRCALPLLRKGYAVTGVDISGNSLKVLKERAATQCLSTHLDIVESDLSKPLEHSHFDAAYCVSTLHLLSENEAGILQIFKNMVSCVKEGGIITIVQPNPLNPLFYLFYLFSKQADWHIEKNIWRFNLKRLQRLLKKTGLVDVTYKYYGFLPTRWINKAPFIYKINSLLNKLPGIQHLSAFIFIRAIKPL